MVPLAVSVAGLLMQWAMVCLLSAAVLIFDRHARSKSNNAISRPAVEVAPVVSVVTRRSLIVNPDGSSFAARRPKGILL